MEQQFTKDRAFYQAKYDHYRNINLWLVVACCCSSLFYVFSDWYLFKEINMTTVPARMFILLPFVLFLVINRRVRDYRIMVPLSYFVGHSIMWCTIWACAYLPDLTFASDGFIIIMSAFIFYGFAAPAVWGMVFTGLIFLDIGIANTFLHYPEFMMMLILGIPFYAGICMLLWAVEHSFVGQYRAQKMLEESAFHDQLTGIYNRNIMNTIVDKNRSITCYGKADIGIILFDIDFFKRVNDTYGHEGGDIVLKELVTIVKQELTMEHYMLRWGGEEFLLFVKGSLKDTVREAEHIRSAVQNQTKQICPVTISLGVTRYRGGDYNEAVKRADDALYKAKNSGRNCVNVKK